MKFIGIGAWTLLTLTLAVSSLLIRDIYPVYAQDEQQKGWLEGTVRDEEGHPAQWSVEVLRDGNRVTSTISDSAMGGLYSIRDLKPGIYEVRVYTNFGTNLRPQRIWGLAIKPGVRSTFNVTLREGKDKQVEEIGQPVVPTQTMLLLSQELEHLQKQIDELKKQIDELKKK